MPTVSDKCTAIITREPTPEQLDEAARLEQACFRFCWTREDVQDQMEKNPYCFLVLMNDEEGNTVGYCLLWEIFESGQIARIGIDPEYQKKGYGSRLLEFAEEHAKQHECELMSLDVRVSNVPAIRLYEKNGYVEVHRTKKYYPDGEDALMMLKGL